MIPIEKFLVILMKKSSKEQVRFPGKCNNFFFFLALWYEDFYRQTKSPFIWY